MVARSKNVTPSPRRGTDPEETLLVTLSAADGAVLEHGTALDPPDAARVAVRLIARRPFLQAGDTLRVTRLANGAIHQPRETD